MAAIISTAPSSDPAEPSRDLPAEISRGGAISELGRRAVLGHDPIDLMHLAVDLLRSVLGVEYAKVLHQPVAGEPLVLIAGSGWRDSPVGEITIPCGRDSQAGYTLLCDEPVLVEDLAGDTRFSGPPFLLDHGVTSGMSVVIRGRSNPYGVLGVHSTRRRRFTPTDSVFLQSVANILGSAVETRRAVDLVEQSARYDAALAECAQALLASSGEDRIQHALEALLVATEATYVFLERNVMDPTIGFCSEFVAEAKDSGAASYKLDNELWDLAPWDQLPTTRESLENGRPITIIPRELEGPEYDLYATDPFPVKSELEVPILINGEWAGLIGFSDQVVERRWSATDVSLLTTAARMLGAFWERESDRQRLEQMNADKDAFLASVSHELRTPLTAVVGFAEVLRDSAHTIPENERAELLEMVVRQGADLTNIINDLLVAARIDVGDLTVAAVPVNLSAQIAQVSESLDRNQAARIDVTCDSALAVGDPDRIRQIVRNLLSNALRYGGEAIHVGVLNGGSTARVLVCDNGAGVPEEDRERIFEPYQRAHNALGIADSIGLGLAISRQLARLMGGDLSYRHQHGESVFELSLPVSE